LPFASVANQLDWSILKVFDFGPQIECWFGLNWFDISCHKLNTVLPPDQEHSSIELDGGEELQANPHTTQPIRASNIGLQQFLLVNYQYYLYVKDKRFHSSCRNVASGRHMPILKLHVYI
jgi:hypothetical protein